MKQTLGLDIVEIDRIRKAHKRLGSRFLKRLFSQEELDYCLRQKNCYPHLAVRLAAKEAVLKAFGDGWQGKFNWTDMIVRRKLTGQPYVTFEGEAKKLAGKIGVKTISLSLSHSRNYAVAAVILNRKK